QHPPGKLDDSEIRKALPQQAGRRGHHKEQDQRSGGEKTKISAAHPRWFTLAQRDISRHHKQEESHNASLKTHAVIVARRVTGKAKAQKCAEEWPPLQKMVVKIVGVGGVALLLKIFASRQEGEEKGGDEQEREQPRRCCQSGAPKDAAPLMALRL